MNYESFNIGISVQMELLKIQTLTDLTPQLYYYLLKTYSEKQVIVKRELVVLFL